MERTRSSQLVNRELEPAGLYFTHLFEDGQVVLRPDWLQYRVPLVRPGWSYLRLYRPATEDLILSKMMRVDPQDRNDILFLVRQSDCDRRVLNAAFDRAQIPEIEEIVQAYQENLRWLREVLAKSQ